MIIHFSDFMESYKKKYIKPPKKIICGGGVELKKDHKFVFLSGLPGTGKTSYLLHLAAELSEEHNFIPLFISFEMSYEKLCERLISQRTLIPLKIIEEGKAEPSGLQVQIDKHINFPVLFCICNSEKELLNDIENLTKSPDFYNSQFIFLWDYLQKMYIKNGIDERSRVNRNLGMITKITNQHNAMSIIATSLNRSGYEKSDLSIFKETGNIEFDADLAILMRLAKKDGDGWKVLNNGELGDERKNKIVNVNFNILKNRHGEEKSFVMEFRKETQSFHEVENGTGEEEQEGEIKKQSGRPRTRWMKEQEVQNGLY